MDRDIPMSTEGEEFEYGDEDWNPSSTSSTPVPLQPEVQTSIVTRRMLSIKPTTATMMHKAIQTQFVDMQTKVPLRILSTGQKISTLVEPRYLEAMALLMSENHSASEAVKAVNIIDTVVWGQTRHLPLRLDKNYMNAFRVLKKLKNKICESGRC